MSTSTRVVWLSLNPDAIARGYWDQGMLESLFAGDLWQVPGGPTWEHIELREPSLDDLLAAVAPGAVLVLPARHHAAPEHVSTLLRVIGRMPWCVLILTGDEEGAFPYREFERLGSVRLWVMTPQADREYAAGTRLIGTGWPPGIREFLRRPDVTEVALGDPYRWGTRRDPWAFLGQVTHKRRQACVDMLLARNDTGTLVPTEGFTQGVPQTAYWAALAAAQVAPCPSGPVSPDSFRTYEALEAGCIPIADQRHPGPGAQGPFWSALFGACPFPLVDGPWAEQTHTIDDLLADWPRRSNRVFAWWQQQKRLMAWRLHQDVMTSGGYTPQDSPAHAITAIVTSSPSPHHPDLDHLDETLRSIFDRLPGAEVIVVFDGVRPEQEHRRAAYQEYVRRALWAANTRWPNVVPIVLDDWMHQAHATITALDEVRSRHILFVEHDTPLTGDIDWAGIVETLDAGLLDVIRLHHETAIGEHHAHMMLDAEPRTDYPVPVVRTFQWSQRPHVSPLGYYRQLLRRTFAPEARTMIEDVLHGMVATAWKEYGRGGYERFRLAIYTPPGNIQRSLHLDSRRLVHGDESTGDPKGEMIFAYPSETPEGAPAPGRR